MEQDYKNIEVIVVDDGSTDNSLEVLEIFRKELGFTLLKKLNGGVVSAINFGLKHVNGDYVVFHACDDISLPYRISHQINVFSNFPDAAFISSNVNIVNSDGSIIANLNKKKSARIIKLNDALLGADISSVGCIYKVDYLRLIELDEKLIAEDPQVHLKLLEGGRFAIVDYGIPVLNYYLHPGSQMATKLTRLLEQHLRLLENYKSEKDFKKAYKKVQTSYASNLAESSKKNAIYYIFKNPQLIKVDGIHRVLVKLLIPKKLYYKFKRVRS